MAFIFRTVRALPSAYDIVDTGDDTVVVRRTHTLPRDSTIVLPSYYRTPLIVPRTYLVPSSPVSLELHEPRLRTSRHRTRSRYVRPMFGRTLWLGP